MKRGSGSVVHIYPFVSIISFLLLPITQCGRTPAMFIFGDSLIDNGNNNFIPTIAKANYLPYGIDLGFPTGRFCNGFTVTDYGAQLLGLRIPVPYLSLQSNTLEIIHGVNYASAAAGILDATGSHYGARITFNGQIALFEKTVKLQLPLLIPDPKKLSDYLASSMFVVNIGSNDYINNYLLPNLYPSSRIYSAAAFADLLIENLASQLMSLYRLGARKMVIVGVGPLGCIPSQLFQQNSTDGSCIDGINNAVSIYNDRLVPLMSKLNSTLSGSFFVLENIYKSFLDMIQKPFSYGTYETDVAFLHHEAPNRGLHFFAGFTENNKACCGNGKYGGELSCLPLQKPCLQRDQFIFWDSYHPTQAANKIVAERCYLPSATDCQPISAYQLAGI